LQEKVMTPVYKTEITAVGDPPKKLTLTSLISGGRSVGIICSRTKATELFIIAEIYSNRNRKCYVIQFSPEFQFMSLNLHDGQSALWSQHIASWKEYSVSLSLTTSC
jgi:hypothetical protein